jgi:hypothetical protein
MVELETKKEISFEEFKKSVWNKSECFNKKFYELFEIKCKKCGSNDIEVHGEYDGSGCYYSGDTGNNVMIIKCHGCGCAKVFSENVNSSMENMAEEMSKTEAE